jgi:hypothetical protein
MIAPVLSVMIEDLHGDVLADTHHELRPVADERVDATRAGREQATHRVHHRQAVDGLQVAGDAGRVDLLAGGVTGRAQPSAPRGGGDEAGRVVAVGVELAVGHIHVAERGTRGGGGVAGGRVAGGQRRRGHVRRPGAGGVGAEEDSCVQRAVERLDEVRHRLVPDVHVHVSDHVVGHRHDRGDLFDVQVLVRPVDLGRLLETGVAVDEVADG